MDTDSNLFQFFWFNVMSTMNLCPSDKYIVKRHTGDNDLKYVQG